MRMRRELRGWRVARRSDKTLTDLVRMLNPVLEGWINYYGRFYKSMLYPVFRHLNDTLMRWAMRKYKRLRRHKTRARRFIADVARRQPGLFAHWRFGVRPPAGRWEPGERRRSRRVLRAPGGAIPPATHLLVMCRTRREAERALVALTVILAELGLELKQAKTRIVHLNEGGEGLDFLGLRRRWVRGNTPRSRHLCFFARWPSRQATQQARDRIREITDRRRLLVAVDDVVQDVNRFLRGWAGYFRYGNSGRQFDKIDHYALDRIARFVAKRHRRGRGYGWKAVAYQSPNRLGLINLNGTIVAPRPNRLWRPGR
jgi:hypothetical protein